MSDARAPQAVVDAKASPDEDIEAVLRNLVFWSYIMRNPFGKVCAVGKGTRADWILNAFKLPDDHAIDCFSVLEDPQDEARALKWRLAPRAVAAEARPGSTLLGGTRDARHYCRSRHLKRDRLHGFWSQWFLKLVCFGWSCVSLHDHVFDTGTAVPRR